MSDFAKRFPNAAESVAMFKNLFGDDVKVEAVYEAGDFVVTKAKIAEGGLNEDVGGERFLRLGRLIAMEAEVYESRASRGKK